MTCIFAIRDGEGQGVIAADTQVSFGSYGLKLVNTPKLVKFPNFIVGICGSTTSYNILQELEEDHSFRNLDIRSQKEARELMREVMKRAKPDFELSDQVKSAQQFTILILTSAGEIYSVYNDMSCLDHADCMAIGSGQDFALGAAYVLSEFGMNVNLLEIAHGAILAADYNSGCSSKGLMIFNQDGKEFEADD